MLFISYICYCGSYPHPKGCELATDYLSRMSLNQSSSRFASLYAANKSGLITATPNMMKVAMTVSAILFIIWWFRLSFLIKLYFFGLPCKM